MPVSILIRPPENRLQTFAYGEVNLEGVVQFVDQLGYHSGFAFIIRTQLVSCCTARRDVDFSTYQVLESGFFGWYPYGDGSQSRCSCTFLHGSDVIQAGLVSSLSISASSSACIGAIYLESCFQRVELVVWESSEFFAVFVRDHK